jgi:hypothetical protein
MYRLAWMMAATLALSGCLDTARNPFKDERPAAGEGIDVIVTNENWATIRVYATTAGRSIPMGTVETGDTRTLQVPRIAVGSFDFRLSVYTIGEGEWFTTDPIVVSQGSTIEFTVENNLLLSHYAVVNR